MRGERIGASATSRSAGRARTSGTVTGRVWIRASAVADLEQPARADAEERVATEPLAALDRLEQVRRSAVIEAEEGADRRLEVGRARRAQEDRVGVGGQALRLRQAERIRCRHRVVASGELETTFRLRDERSCLPRCHPHSAMPHSRDRRVAGSRGDRSALPCIAGALRRSLLASRLAPVAFGPEAPGSIPRRRRSGFAPTTGSLDRRATGTRPVHSPLFVMCREYGRRRGAPSSGRGDRRLGSHGRQHGQNGQRSYCVSVLECPHRTSVLSRAWEILSQLATGRVRPPPTGWLRDLVTSSSRTT